MKEGILKLRAEGKTYNEIKEILGCSKGTISYHCGIKREDKVPDNTLKIDKIHTEKKVCLNCEKIVNFSHTKYCSILCHKEYEYTNMVSKWLNKEIQGHTGLGSSIKNFVRRYLLELNKYSCSICGWNKRHPVDGKPLVEIDHINGDSKDSFLDNLRVLCPNCHSETVTFRARNKKSSRIRK